MGWLWVFVGGGAGALARWHLTALAPAPWGTVGVNVLGSFLLAALLHPSTGLPDPWRLGLGTGLMGGLTTYSTFNTDVLVALADGQPGRAAALVAATLLGCLAGGAAGWWLAASLGRA